MRPRRKRGDSCLAGRASCPSYLCAVQGVAAIETSGWLPRPPATYPPIHLPAGQRARFIDAAKGPPQEAPLPVPPYSCCTAPRRADQLALPHQPTYYTSNATRVTEQGMPLSLLLRPSARPSPSPFPPLRATLCPHCAAIDDTWRCLVGISAGSATICRGRTVARKLSTRSPSIIDKETFGRKIDQRLAMKMRIGVSHTRLRH
uniref:Uncharacterized protein n=1 Tax=Plectus sambesii TaxID=2011161 RepID=A0A914XRJ4_9BILA